MKGKITLRSVLLPLLALFILPGLTLAQQGQQAEPNVRIKVEKNEAGNTSVTENDVRVEDNTSVQQLLRDYGLDQEFGDLKPGEEIEIIVRRKKGPETIKEFSMDIDRLAPPPPPPFPAPPAFEEMEKKPLLGIRYHMVKEWEAEQMGTEFGAEVVQVISGTGADLAGLEVGDVILSVDGKNLKTIDQLHSYVATKKPGDKVKIKYLRDGNKATTTAVLGERKTEGVPYGGLNWNEFRPPSRGNGTFNDSDFLKRHEEKMQRPFLGVYLGQASEIGVQITGVMDNSTAKAMGLQENDIITAVNGKSIRSVEELSLAVKSAKAGEVISIDYIRDNHTYNAQSTLKTRGESSDGNMFFKHGEKLPHPDGKAYFFHKEGDNGTEEYEIELQGSMEEIMSQLDAMNEVDGRFERIIIDDENEEIISETRITIKMVEISAQEAQSMTEKTGQNFQGSELEVESLNLFPNPNNGQFSLTFELPTTGSASVKIFDSNGVMVYSELLRNFNGNYNNEIDLSGFAKGVYFLRINQGEKQFTRKIVTQ